MTTETQWICTVLQLTEQLLQLTNISQESNFELFQSVDNCKMCLKEWRVPLHTTQICILSLVMTNKDLTSRTFLFLEDLFNCYELR